MIRLGKYGKTCIIITESITGYFGKAAKSLVKICTSVTSTVNSSEISKMTWNVYTITNGHAQNIKEMV